MTFSEKMNEMDGKLPIILRTNKINIYFFSDWKKTNEIGQSRKMNEQNKNIERGHL